MTNEAVSSISVNSGAEWTGEIQTKLIGVWLDYGLLLVTYCCYHYYYYHYYYYYYYYCCY